MREKREERRGSEEGEKKGGDEIIVCYILTNSRRVYLGCQNCFKTL